MQIEALGSNGERARVVRTFQVDARDPYQAWIDENEREGAQSSDGGDLAYRPLLSVITPVYKTSLHFLTRCVESVQRQTYRHWELLLIDDGSADPALSAALEEFAARDERIKLRPLAANSGIAGASNHGLREATGDYVGFLDHDDELAPFALGEVAAALNGETRPDVLFSDEDKITADGVRFEPFFKPGFSIDLLRSFNYVCHFLVVRRGLLEEVGGLRLGFDGSQDHDLVLRLSERTRNFRRIPKVLYHWRAVAGSTALDISAKPEASRSARRALEQHLHRVGAAGDVEETAPMNFRIQYRRPAEDEVLLVMPTGGNMAHLQGAVESILFGTRYSNFRLAVADNSGDSQAGDYLRKFERDGRLFTIDVRDQPFNFSRICNQAAAKGDAPLILFVNDDVKVNNKGWLRALAQIAIQSDVGAVGARLLYPDGRIQHAGVTLGLFGCAGHAFRGMDGEIRHYFGFADTTRNTAAVTGACLMTRRAVFEELGGFDEIDLPVAFQDVDYCLKAVSRGLRVVYTPYAELYHFESASKENRHLISHPRETALMLERWGDWIEDDPFYNPNLTRLDETFSLRING